MPAVDLERRHGERAPELIKAGWQVLYRLMRSDPAIGEAIDRLLSDRRTAAWAIETASIHASARAARAKATAKTRSAGRLLLEGDDAAV